MISNSNNSNMAKCEKRRRSASGLSDGSTGRGMSRGAEARDIAPLPSYNSSTHPPPDIDPLQIYTRPELTSIYTLYIFNSDAAWMSDGACVWKCVYETLWNIVGRQNNVEKMSGSVFKRYQVSGLELWRGGGRSQYSLCLRTSDSFDSCRRESFIASRLPQGANM